MTEIQSEKTKKPSSATPAAKTKAAQIEALLRRKTGAEALLRRKTGACLVDLTKATGWQPHSIRAALTGLRKTGADISRERNVKGATVYRIVR
jgi:hypothetical protein